MMVSNCGNTAARQESREFDCLVVNIVFIVTGTDVYPSLSHTNDLKLLRAGLFIGFMTGTRKLPKQFSLKLFE